MLTINYGKDYIKTAYDTLVASDIKTYLQKNLSVSLKPNLVVERPDPAERLHTRK